MVSPLYTEERKITPSTSIHAKTDAHQSEQRRRDRIKRIGDQPDDNVRRVDQEKPERHLGPAEIVGPELAADWLWARLANQVGCSCQPNQKEQRDQDYDQRGDAVLRRDHGERNFITLIVNRVETATDSPARR